MKQYFTYIITNKNKTVLYAGMTNDLSRRMQEHFDNIGIKKSFAGKYRCYILIWYEVFNGPQQAIDREKEIKGWSREKKEELINEQNAEWDDLRFG